MGIVALGQGMVMLSGGLDISIGNTMFFVIVLGGNLMSRHPQWSFPIILLLLLFGAFVGFVNGIGVARLKVSAIIMYCQVFVYLVNYVQCCGSRSNDRRRGIDHRHCCALPKN